MLHKIGDKVRIRTDLVLDKKYGNITFSADMYNFKGKEVTIADVDTRSPITYYIKEEGNKDVWNYWTSEMFEDNTCNFTVEKIGYYGNIITLNDGTRIYHPSEGNPIQLSSKPKVI